MPAVPLTTLVRRSLKHDLAAIVGLAQERGAQTIVVGYPLRLDGTVGPAASKVDRFLDELRACFPGTVVRQDERLTTAAAHKKLQQLELSGSKRRTHVDALAAVEILSSYLATSRQR